MGGEYTGIPMSDPKSYLSPAEISGIIKATDKDEYKRLFYIIAKTGRRVSEIVRCLRPADIDFENNLANFTILKRKAKTRILLPVDEKAIKVLKRQIRNNKIGDDDYIFGMSRQRADQVFKKSAERIGLFERGTGLYRKMHIHMLRHSFAKLGAEHAKNPADLVKLQKLLGHSRIDTTMFYLKFNPKEERELLKEMWKV